MYIKTLRLTYYGLITFYGVMRPVHSRWPTVAHFEKRPSQAYCFSRSRGGAQRRQHIGCRKFWSFLVCSSLRGFPALLEFSFACGSLYSRFLQSQVRRIHFKHWRMLSHFGVTYSCTGQRSLCLLDFRPNGTYRSLESVLNFPWRSSLVVPGLAHLISCTCWSRVALRTMWR